MVRRLLAGAGALLALFHVWLFAGQLWDGRLDDPALILRWLAAGGLVAGLAAMHRRGLSVVRSRQAATIWLLAALLHGPALASRIDDGGALGLPEVAATLSQLAIAAVAAIGLGLVLSHLRRRPATVRAFQYVAAHRTHVTAPAVIALDSLCPRPPPAAI